MPASPQLMLRCLKISIKLNNTLALTEHVYSEVHVNQDHAQTPTKFKATKYLLTSVSVKCI